MILHLFTPYHDEALAAGTPHYYPGKAARALCARWWALPALWAQPGDVVLCPDDAVSDGSAFRKEGVEWVKARDLASLPLTGVQPWGWDALVVHQLQKAGVNSSLLPDTDRLHELRELESRQTTVRLLPALRQAVPETVGEAKWCTHEEEVWQALSAWKQVMVKSPWSGSGRGVFPMADGLVTESQRGRVHRILCQQGALEVEPRYRRLADFAMEYRVSREGVQPLGLSVFQTAEHGGYIANLVGEESLLLQMLPEAVRLLLPQVTSALVPMLKELVGTTYEGPLGIDMMAVENPQGGISLHPCVEMNLRPTMGYVALHAYRCFRLPGLHALNLDARTASELCLPVEPV